MAQPEPRQAAGLYTVGGIASLLRAGEEQFLLLAQAVNAGAQTIAVQLERIRNQSYPWGFAVQLKCNAPPGTFEVDIQGSETDEVGSYVTLGSGITTVNTGNFGRFDTTAFYPRFVSCNFKTWPNPATLVTLVITR